MKLEDKGAWNVAQFCLVSFFTVGGWHGFLRRPYDILQYKGVYLLMEYLLFLFFCFPVLWVQFTIGGHTGRGIVGSFRRHIPVLQGIGWSVILLNVLMMLYTSVLTTWMFLYLGYSVDPPDAMTSCDGYAADACVAFKPNSTNTNLVGTSPQENFWLTRAWKPADLDDFSGGLDTTLTPPPVGVLALVWIGVFGLCCLGPTVLGYASYVLSPLCLIAMLIVIIYGYFYIDVNTESVHETFFDFKVEENVEYHKLLRNVCYFIISQLSLFMAQPVLLGKYGERYPGGLLAGLYLVIHGFLITLPTLMVAPYITFAQDLGNTIIPPNTYSYYGLFTVRMPEAFLIADVPTYVRFFYYFAMAIFTLMSLAVMFLTVQDTIVDLFRLRWREHGRNSKILNVCVSLGLCLVLFCLSILFVAKPQVPLNVLVMEGGRALFFVYIAILAVAYIISLVKVDRHKIERILFGIFFGLCAIGAVVCDLWYFVDEDIADVPSQEQYENIETQGAKEGAFWVSAILPLIFGLVVGAIVVAVEGSRPGKPWSQVVCGINDSPEGRARASSGIHHGDYPRDLTNPDDMKMESGFDHFSFGTQ